MLEFIQTHQRGIIIYVLVHVATYYLFVHVLGKGHLRLDSKDVGRLEPFKRSDVKNWGLIRNFPMVLTFWPRIILGVTNLFIYTVIVLVLMIGVDVKNP